MNAKQISRDLRRLAQHDVPREPDLWPAVQRRLANPGTQGTSDSASSYVWHTDAAARPRRWGTAARIVAAGGALVLIVALLAALFNLPNGQPSGDQQPAALGGQASPVASRTVSATPTIAMWSRDGSVNVPIEPFNNSRRLQGTATAWLYLSGDLSLNVSLSNSPDTLFWHVLTGDCSVWSGTTEKAVSGKELAPAFVSASGASVVSARTVIPVAQTHQPMALVAFDTDNKGAAVGCAAIPAVPDGFTVSAHIDPSVPATCAVTRPADPVFIPSNPDERNPPGPSDFWYGSDALRTALPLSGAWSHATSPIPHWEKIFWQSTDYQGEAVPDITITGKRLDGDAGPLIVSQPTTASGPGIGLSMLTSIGFPAPGCWQVTADYGGHSLSFVAWIAGRAPVATPSSIATPVSLAQVDAVWDAIADKTDDTIDPILRPSQLPPGFDSIQLRNAVPGAYEVGYHGASAELGLGVEAYNPPEVGSSGSVQQITVRGQRAVLQIESTVHPKQRIWLWWQEPGVWTQSGVVGVPGISYMISASGLTPDQVIQIANDLTLLLATGGP